MKRIFLSVILMSCMICAGSIDLCAQSYDAMWKNVEKLAKEEKPKSAIAEAEKILAKAKKEKAFAQMLKAQFLITEKKCDLDPELFMPDEYEKMFALIENDKSLSADTKAGRLAVLHCMLAGAYDEMRYSSIRDFDEESRADFISKSKDHTLAALADMQTLTHIDGREFEPIIEQREDGKLFNHDLLHAILNFTHEERNFYSSITDKIDTYNKAISVYEQNGNRNAATILRLKVIEIQRRSNLKSIKLNQDAARKKLEELHSTTQDIEAGADVDAFLVSCYDDEEQKLAFVRQAISHWKGSKRLNEFKNIEAYIMAQKIAINYESSFPYSLKLTFDNATSAKLTIREYSGKDKNGNALEKGKIVRTLSYTLPLDAEKQQRKANSLPIHGQMTDTLELPAGRYVFVAETNGARQVTEISVTSIRMISMPLPGNKENLVIVLDSKTGRPVESASVMLMDAVPVKYGQKPLMTFKTDANGEAKYPNTINGKKLYLTVLAVRNADEYGTPQEDITSTSNFRPQDITVNSEDVDNVKAFTDRSIYRPGQTVHGSVIMYRQKGDEMEVVAGKQLYYRLYDHTQNEIFSDTITTNEMGSASFEFVLPEDGKLGSYHIEIEDEDEHDLAHITIEMNEYKRPTFDVQFTKEKNSTKHTLGDTVQVHGMAKTFSDVPVMGAKVNYTIEWGERFSPLRWNYIDRNTLINDECTTDEQGNFTIAFPTELPVEVYADSITFTVKAEATDMNGEMQRGEYSFNVKNPNYKKEKEKDDAPQDEFKCSSDEISETQDAVITFKAKEKNALVYYYILSDDKIIQKSKKVLNGDSLKFNVKYKKDMGDVVTVNLFYAHNDHVFYTSKRLFRARPDKTLNLSWSTFRDKLTPGQQEEWVLSVKDKNGRSVSGAELCAVMYDASLDKFNMHDWDFRLNFPRFGYYYRLNASHNRYTYTLHLNPKYNVYDYKYRLYDIIHQFEHQRYYKSRPEVMLMKTASPMMKGNARIEGGAVYDVLNEVAVSSKQVAPTGDAASSGKDTEMPSFNSKNLRTNLSELAFFYPHLTTDKNGEAHISFTLPDCLTEWKFMGFVHTKDVDYGVITAHATAKKNFMVQPNMPRFLREGDKAQISAKIINMSQSIVTGSLSLRILNALTEEEIYSQNTDFRVEASSSVPVTFTIDSAIPAGDYICDITATDGSTSDGERNRLPILSTKVDVVENVPFYLDGASTKDVVLSTLFNGGSTTATHKNIKVSYTDNPALEVFKSLKALQNPKHNNAPCLAASLYSNLVMVDMSRTLGNLLTDFNVSASEKTATEAIEKLTELQLADGSWPWFEGMDGSAYITLSVAENLTRLQDYFMSHNKDIPNEEITDMLAKSLRYLDRNARENYNYRKSHKFSLIPSNDDLRYLAIAANPDKEMQNKYLDEYVKHFKQLTIFGRSKGVLLLQKYNRLKEARKFRESVKEYTIYKEGFGRYFATDLAYYSWMDYRIPTQLAAMRAIEDKQYLLDMQLWLLRQKQTQTWDNPLNALDIADFLLTNDKENSIRKPAQPSLSLDGTAIMADSTYSVTKAEKISVTKTSPSISWGNVQGTFKEDVNNLKSYSSGELTISRKVIRNGNKVTIRLILHADRDMDFVQVMSQHAASLEPLNTRSGYQWLGGRGGYMEMHDSYATIFFDKFTRGTTTIDLDYYQAREGEYNSGYAEVKCTYAPEFGAHTGGE